MLSVYGEIKIFAGSTGINFAKKICKCLNTELGDSEAIQFSDGNIFVRVTSYTAKVKRSYTYGNDF